MTEIIQTNDSNIDLDKVIDSVNQNLDNSDDDIDINNLINKDDELINNIQKNIPVDPDYQKERINLLRRLRLIKTSRFKSYLQSLEHKLEDDFEQLTNQDIKNKIDELMNDISLKNQMNMYQMGAEMLPNITEKIGTSFLNMNLEGYGNSMIKNDQYNDLIEEIRLTYLSETTQNVWARLSMEIIRSSYLYHVIKSTIDKQKEKQNIKNSPIEKNKIIVNCENNIDSNESSDIDDEILDKYDDIIKE